MSQSESQTIGLFLNVQKQNRNEGDFEKTQLQIMT